MSLLSEDVYIIGAGETKFGELWERSLRELAVEAGLKAVENAGVYSKDVQILYGSNSLAGTINAQNDIGSLIADFSGIASNHIPAIRIEASSASGAAAVREAYLAIRSGEYDCVMVGAVEKMTDLYGPEMLDHVSTLLDREWEAFFGATPAAMAALTARKYMHDFGVEKEQLMTIPISDHNNASMNPDAHYRNKLTMESAMGATMIAEPLNMMDCAPMSDGAAALVIASGSFMKKNRLNGVRILSSGISQDFLALHSRNSIYTMDSTVLAARQAMEKAGVKHKDISFVEVHDSYSIYGLTAIEDLGFAKKGKADEVVQSGIDIKGALPLNPSGGLKAKGYPIGAAGVSQFVEGVLQLTEKAGQRQVKGARYGMMHSVAGTGSTSLVHIIGGE